MSFGIIEIISLLLGLSGFGVHPNPKAPTADQALEFAMADADVVAEVDLASLVPGNYKVLTQLPEQPQIRASPELASLVRKAINEVEGFRGLAQTASGIDIATDLADATICVQFGTTSTPSFVMAVHGKFTTAVISKIAATIHQTPIKIGGGVMLDNGSEPSLGVTRSGVLLVGTGPLVRDRLADGWRMPPHGAGTNLGYAADVINAKPVAAVVLTMSRASREQAKLALGTNFLTDLIQRHKAAAFVVYHDGIGWTWVDTSKPGLDSMVMVSDGFLDVMRAAQIAPRGIAKILIGGLDSYRGRSPQIDDIIKHKDDILKLVDTYTGDGNFKIARSVDAATFKLSVRATGKSLSEVLPAGLVVPLGVFGFFMARGAATQPPAVWQVQPPAAPTKQPALNPHK